MTIQERAIGAINKTERLSGKNTFIHNTDPIAKFIVTVIYIAFINSVDIYAPWALLPFLFYNIIIFILAEIPPIESLGRILVIMPFILIVGLGNVIFDNSQIEIWYGVYVSGGLLSFISILLRGFLGVAALYAFICTTGVYAFCRRLFVNRYLGFFAGIIALMYRYIILMLEESSDIMKAYSLRKGSNKISLKEAGSVLGLFFMRVADKADKVYNAMRLRGFCIEAGPSKISFKDVLYILFFVLLFLLFRLWGR